MIVLKKLSEVLNQNIVLLTFDWPILMNFFVVTGCPPPCFRCPALPEACHPQGKEGRAF